MISPNSFKTSPLLDCILYVRAIMPSRAFSTILNNKASGNNNKAVLTGKIQQNKPVPAERKMANHVIPFAVKPARYIASKTGFSNC